MSDALSGSPTQIHVPLPPSHRPRLRPPHGWLPNVALRPHNASRPFAKLAVALVVVAAVRPLTSTMSAEPSCPKPYVTLHTIDVPFADIDAPTHGTGSQDGETSLMVMGPTRRSKLRPVMVNTVGFALPAMQLNVLGYASFAHPERDTT